jgi:hypothetical protein
MTLSHGSSEVKPFNIAFFYHCEWAKLATLPALLSNIFFVSSHYGDTFIDPILVAYWYQLGVALKRLKYLVPTIQKS